LLRQPSSFSPLAELTSGGFRTVLDDSGASDPAAVTRVLFCSGKVFYDLAAGREERKDGGTAILRLEQLHPFPDEALRAILAHFGAARDFAWVQEEARNMGAWTFVRERLADLLPLGATLRYAGRAPSASPATGNATVHKRELAAFIAEAFGAGN
ncbi:MAG TPA: 2-oxoglutarate dehydrogenase E1 component, partial [Thermoanaerobaculia bacterium]|nr:2-oxoglutarate dehydrogenase E1 component [Thermoanaerobaculia bacterium]